MRARARGERRAQFNFSLASRGSEERRTTARGLGQNARRPVFKPFIIKIQQICVTIRFCILVQTDFILLRTDSHRLGQTRTKRSKTIPCPAPFPLPAV